jgi:uncharacterized membrane protein YGL010W
MVQVKAAAASSRNQTSFGQIVVHAASAAILFACMKSAFGFQTKESAMAFYGVYHQSPGNQLVHFIGVPCIVWTLLIVQSTLTLYKNVTWALVMTIFYFVFYLSMDRLGALLYAPVLACMYASAQYLTRHQSYWNKRLVLRWAVALHLFAWYLQIHPGHFVLEGARPALMTSVGDALTTAPLFAFYEGVWFLGMRRDFQTDVKRLVDEYTIELCANGADMRICGEIAKVK